MVMKLPALDDPRRYRGLYVYDFGDWSAVGYTAEEIAVLLEDQHTAGGKVYRIRDARPDGTMELYAVSPERFQLESAMLFYRDNEPAARADFAELARLAEAHAPPCRARLELVRRGGDGDRTRYVVALLYPAEYDEDISAWLLRTGYAGGDTVEGGISRATNYFEEVHDLIERNQLWATTSVSSRSPQEVRASIRRAVQR